MVSLDPELFILLLVVMSTSASFGAQNGSNIANCPKPKLESLFLQRASKIEDSLRFSIFENPILPKWPELGFPAGLIGQP